MRLLLSLFGTIWVITFTAAPTMGAGWLWDLGNALGFATMAGMLCLMIAGNSRCEVRAHEMLGYAVLLVALIHALWFLLFDAAAVEFVMPDAPAYMWAGIAALALVAILVVQANRALRRWHLHLSVLAIGMAAYHIVSSGLYLRTGYQVFAFVTLIALAAFVPRHGFGSRRITMTTSGAYLAVCAIGTFLFAAIRNTVL